MVGTKFSSLSMSYDAYQVRIARVAAVFTSSTICAASSTATAIVRLCRVNGCRSSRRSNVGTIQILLNEMRQKIHRDSRQVQVSSSKAQQAAAIFPSHSKQP